MKKRIGDWEADTVQGKQGTGAIVSLVERKSKLYLIRKVPAKSATDVAQAMVGMLWKYRGDVRTITADKEDSPIAIYRQNIVIQRYYYLIIPT